MRKQTFWPWYFSAIWKTEFLSTSHSSHASADFFDDYTFYTCSNILLWPGNIPAMQKLTFDHITLQQWGNWYFD
jgi:hypothetical protein